MEHKFKWGVNGRKFAPCVTVIENCDTDKIPLYDLSQIKGIDLSGCEITVASTAHVAEILFLDETDKLLHIDKKLKLQKGELLLITPIKNI